MALFWKLGTGAVLLVIASPAAAQYYDNSVISELQRVDQPTQDYCKRATRIKREDVENARGSHEAGEQFHTRVAGMNDSSLEAEEAALRRRIMIAEARGDRNENTGPNSLGDMNSRLDTIVSRRKGEADNTGFGRNQTYETYESERRRYNDALLNCLEFKDRYPSRQWNDPDPPVNSAAFGAAPGPANDWDTLPDAGTEARAEARPVADPNDRRLWMTGTFDTGGGVMTLNPAGGRYEASNGRMSTTAINGAVMEGIWTQDSSGQQCKDGGYHGRFRLVFTETGFSGLFGYCDEPPGAPGGFHGTRRRE